MSWKKTFGNSYNDILGRCISTKDQGYLLYGCVKPDAATNQNGFDWGIYKLDSCGKKQWEKRFSAGVGYNELYAAVQTLDGGYLLAGTSVNNSGDFPVNYGGIDPWIFKLDAAGNVQWKKNVSGSVNADYYYSLLVLPDSSFLAGGVYNRKMDVSSPQNSSDFGRLTRMDKSGQVIWDKIIDTMLIGTVWDIKLTAGNKIVAGGFTAIATGGMPTGRSNAKIAQFSMEGLLEWNKTISGTQSAQLRSLLCDAQGCIYAIGNTDNINGEFAGNHGSNDILLYKYDRFGNKLWGKLLGGTKEDLGWQAQFLGAGTLLIAGHSLSSDGDFSIYKGNNDAFVLKLDTAGNLLHNINFGGSGHERGISLSVNKDSSFVMAGYSGPGSLLTVNGIADLFIAKFRHMPVTVVDSFICKPMRFQNIWIDKDTTLSIAVADGCGNTVARTTYRFHYKEIMLTSLRDTSVDVGTILSLNTSSNATVSWAANPFLSCTSCLSPTVKALSPQQYIVSASNGYC
ncbi:MAG: hypothetical protein EOO04_28775, partial [Chitinophagaceae bacterium]